MINKLKWSTNSKSLCDGFFGRVLSPWDSGWLGRPPLEGLPTRTAHKAFMSTDSENPSRTYRSRVSEFLFLNSLGDGSTASCQKASMFKILSRVYPANSLHCCSPPLTSHLPKLHISLHIKMKVRMCLMMHSFKIKEKHTVCLLKNYTNSVWLRALSVLVLENQIAVYH